MNAAMFFCGIAAATFAASGLFFMKFWTASRDRFFLQFGVACWLLALERAISVVVHGTQIGVRNADVDRSSWIYLIRLMAFCAIALGAVAKNRREKR